MYFRTYDDGCLISSAEFLQMKLLCRPHSDGTKPAYAIPRFGITRGHPAPAAEGRILFDPETLPACRGSTG